MENRSLLVQARVLIALILLNFLAQIPYYTHLYAGRQSLAVSLRSSLIMAVVFAFFMLAAILLFRRQRQGYGLMLAFLAIEFLFYLSNLIGSTIHGYAPFFQVHNPDIILRVIYSIGYLNLFASGYFLLLLLLHRDFFAARSA